MFDSKDIPLKSLVNVWGYSWFGIISIRIFLDDKNYKTFWHIALWKFTLGFSLPASIVNIFEKKKVL